MHVLHTRLLRSISCRELLLVFIAALGPPASAYLHYQDLWESRCITCCFELAYAYRSDNVVSEYASRQLHLPLLTFFTNSAECFDSTSRDVTA
jgi:hypothetical protein